MRRSIRPAGAAFPTLLALAMLTGCGAHHPGASASSSPAAQAASPVPSGHLCGMGKTAAGVPVQVQVVHGTACPAAMQVERTYAAELASGKAPGNGGGGPVSVSGWVCTGFNTPEILRTGDTSKCTRSGAEIVEVLPSPSASPSS
ncbi:MAG: hypothetical protein ACLPKI_16020 [Streptosporangiaceae bacterium]